LRPPIHDRNLFLLIDASLADSPLADAFKLVDYNAISCSKQFPDGTPDQTIIRWLGMRGGIWVTADEKARRAHSQEIQKAGIHIVWVHRPKEGMSKKDQLLLLLSLIDFILEEISRSKQPLHFLAKYNGTRPKLERLPN
jgi:hypothetical protein